MQHLASAAYSAWKHGLVVEALRRAGVDCEVEPLQLSPPYSRRRASLTLERRAGSTRVGFNRRGTHDVVDMTMCLILRAELFALVEPLRHLPLVRDGERADIVMTAAESAIDLVLERKRPLGLPEREALAAFAEDHDLARVSWRSGPRTEAEPVCHRLPFRERFGEVFVDLPPGGFLQATDEGETTLAAIVSNALAARHHVVDLFAGSGTFTFAMSATARVHAVEGNDAAVKSIQAVRRPGVTCERRDLFRDPVTDFTGYDAAIFDPPYVGAEAQAAALAMSKLPVVIGVSCNPVSFARDARLLVEGGYRLDRVVPVDQFLWSAEVEIAAVFRR